MDQTRSIAPTYGQPDGQGDSYILLPNVDIVIFHRTLMFLCTFSVNFWRIIILKLDPTDLFGLTQALKGADVTIVTFTFMEN